MCLETNFLSGGISLSPPGSAGRGPAPRPSHTRTHTLTLVGDAERQHREGAVPLQRRRHALLDGLLHAAPDGQRVLLHPPASGQLQARPGQARQRPSQACALPPRPSPRRMCSRCWSSSILRRRPVPPARHPPGMRVDLRKLHLAAGQGAALAVVQEEASALGALQQQQGRKAAVAVVETPLEEPRGAWWACTRQCSPSLPLHLVDSTHTLHSSLLWSHRRVRWSR